MLILPKGKPAEASSGERITKLLAQGRTAGKYRLGSVGLSEVPHSLYTLGALPGIPFWEEVAAKSVDLSRNSLNALPEELVQLEELQSLNVSYNQLTKLPEDYGSFRSLCMLDVSHNQLTSLGTECSTSLQMLACGHNNITELGFGPLPGLLQLHAEFNSLKKLPETLLASSRLLKLNLAGNNLVTIPDLKELTALEEIDISGNAISGLLPPSIGSLKSLKVLNLRENKLAALPPEMTGLARLSELLLGSNHLQELPSGLCRLSQLDTLDLAQNALAAIPADLARLSLRVLDLRSNSLGNLPPQLGRMTMLKAMPVTGNPLRGFRPSLLEGPLGPLQAALRHRLPPEELEDQEGQGSSSVDAVSEGFRQLSLQRGPEKTLNIARLALKQLPEQVWDPEVAKTLTGLDASANGLEHDPSDRLAELENLRILNLAQNSLRSWPLPLEKGPPKLTDLNLANNPISHVPGLPLQCCSETLVTLDLSGLQSEDLGGAHACWKDCQRLRSLRLVGCSLRTYPAALSSLRGLESLSLASNSLAQIPEEVTVLGSLTYLGLANNCISSLPPKLGLLLTTLQVLELQGNPLRTLRRPILEKGTKAVLEYLSTRIPVN